MAEVVEENFEVMKSPFDSNLPEWSAAWDSIPPAAASDFWFKAHPKEEPMNHSLATVQRRTRRVRSTQTNVEQGIRQ
jgi:hypothetical protein